MGNRDKKKPVSLIRRIVCMVLAALVVLSLAGCGEKPYIGEIVISAPITALMFEMGEDNGEVSGGVVYRRVNDINKLLAAEDIPVLVVFMDGRAISNSAIAFTEELCDKFSGKARIVRVNVELSDNTDEIQNLIDLFGVQDYPWFAVTYRGAKKSAISGYSANLEADIIRMIENADQ